MSLFGNLEKKEKMSLIQPKEKKNTKKEEK